MSRQRERATPLTAPRKVMRSKTWPLEMESVDMCKNQGAKIHLLEIRIRLPLFFGHALRIKSVSSFIGL
jgi:hypothetical protein